MKIYKTLEISEVDYDEIVLKTFLDWCGHLCKSPIALQLVLTSKAVQNYFKHRYNELETQFKDELNGFDNLSKSDKICFYADITGTIFNNYPSALLPRLKSKERALNNFN